MSASSSSPSPSSQSCNHHVVPPPSHSSWPHEEINRRPWWESPHGVPPQVDTPLTRFVAS
eukprot:7452008-Pyramimonas_sp.AAC.1